GSGFRVCQVAREKGDLAKRGEGTEPGKREPKERVDEQAHRYDAVDLSGTVGIVQTGAMMEKQDVQEVLEMADKWANIAWCLAWLSLTEDTRKLLHEGDWMDYTAGCSLMS
ncbi:hypothetical protein LEMLEM_LOCUS23969, partial [Lemmus lemmus]